MKTNLAAIAHAQKAYWPTARSFTDDLGAVGWRLDGTPRYLYGFTSDALPAGSNCNDSAELVASGHGKHSTAMMTNSAGLPLTDTDLPAAEVSRDAFTIGAVGNLDADITLDRWTLNSDGLFTLITDDLSD